MSFRIRGLSSAPFASLFGLSDDALAARGVVRCRVDSNPGYPDRVTLCDLEVGESALLLNFTHQPARNAYQSSHAIFVGESEREPFDGVDTTPAAFRTRWMSLRAFDAHDTMLDADLVDGRDVESLIARLFADPRTAYLHAHYAKRGCFAARIDRAS